MLPDGLDELPPGPALGAVLAQLDRSRLTGSDLITVLQAQARQLAYQQAELLGYVAEVIVCPPDYADDGSLARMDCPGEFAGFEVAAALTLTRRAGDVLVDLAYDLRHRLPAVLAALAAGEIDQPRARLLCDRTGHLDDDLARRVVGELLPRAGLLTTGQLAARLDRLILAADPQAAAARRERAGAERRGGRPPRCGG